MQEVTIKKDNKIKLDTIFHSSLNPKFIFLPIKKGYDLLVEDNDYVYKNDKVLVSPLGSNIYSSISGRVLGIKEMTYFNGSTTTSLVIENDFKENIRKRCGARKYINNYTKEEFFDTLKKVSLHYKGNDTVSKIKKIESSFIVNCVELEPYFGNKYFILKKHIEEVLETIDLIDKITGNNKVLFVIKNNESELINELMNILGTYPNIELKLINDAYPNGRDEVLKKYFKLDLAQVIDVEEIYNIYEILKRGKPVTEKFITITGNAVNPSCIIKVKMGSLLSEIFTSHFDFTSKNVDVYINGLLGGELVHTLKYVVDSNIDGILIMEHTEIEKEACINCGICSKCCPMGLNPKYVFDHEGRVKPIYYEKCLQCGLCNYVCPSNIDLKSCMKGCRKNEKGIE